MTVFVTGASGYIGGAVLRALHDAGISPRAGLRTAAALPGWATPVITGDLAIAELDLTGISAVVHAAGLGHRRGVHRDVWRRANVDAAVRVARQAAASGVVRFVLISTAYVHGRVAGMITDDSPSNPSDDYAASKLEAEREVTAAFGGGLTILRPAAVIGPHCPGNLQRLMGWLRRGVPLPFGAICNRRSFIDASDLGRLAVTALQSPAPPPHLLAASPETISTPELIRVLAEGLAVSARLVSPPPALLAVAASLLGRSATWQSVTGDFAAAPAAALRLGWSPGASLRQRLLETAQAYPVL